MVRDVKVIGGPREGCYGTVHAESGDRLHMRLTVVIGVAVIDRWMWVTKDEVQTID